MQSHPVQGEAPVLDPHEAPPAVLAASYHGFLPPQHPPGCLHDHHGTEDGVREDLHGFSFVLPAIPPTPDFSDPSLFPPHMDELQDLPQDQGQEGQDGQQGGLQAD